uniref:Uncharacterized protein n=1 Tax=Glossina palpalis gambiensis TaxID=67801 RepID=A0A1B0BLP2_9MUSC
MTVSKVLVPILREKGFEIKVLWGRTVKEAEEFSSSQNIAFLTNKIDDVLLRKDVDLVLCCATTKDFLSLLSFNILRTFRDTNDAGETLVTRF